MTNQSELEYLKSKLGDKTRRLFSGKLYFIKDKYGDKIPFIPNDFQKYYYENKHTKNIILKARQLGFSTFIDIDILDDFLFSKHKNYGIVAQDLNAANSIFNEKIKFAFDNLPVWLKSLYILKIDRKGELNLEKTFSSIAVDTSFRSATLQRLHISEFGKICNKYPEKAREIVTGALNTLQPTSQVDIESTAEGNSGYFFDMSMRALSLQESSKQLGPMDYKFHFYPRYLDKTYELEDESIILNKETLDYFSTLKNNDYIRKYFSDVEFSISKMKWWQKKKEEQQDDMIREYPSYPKEAFDLAIKGSYYEKELTLAREQNRICRVQYDPALETYTYWDLGGAGGGDLMAVWYVQIFGKEIRLIDYEEGNGYSIVEFINTFIKPKPYKYTAHKFPHDIKVTELSSGVTRFETAQQELGNICEVVEKLSIEDGINAVKQIFGSCYFDEKNCYTGVSRLENYKRKYDDKNGMFLAKPLHDINSNGADSFRYMGVDIKNILDNRSFSKNNPGSFVISYEDFGY